MNNVKWALPKDLLQRSIEIMRPHGFHGNEGLALWLGRSNGPAVEITHVIKVSGSGFITSPLFMSLSLRAIATLTDLADRMDLYLVGQIHSHPGFFTDLSELDKAHGIRIPGYLSLVCPHYAQNKFTELADCGIHVFEGGNYRRLESDEVANRILITSTQVSQIRCEVVT